MKSVIIVLLMLIFTAGSAGADFLQEGEELVYEVSFFKIKLGTIKIITEGTKEKDGIKKRIVKAKIASYPEMPFVEIKADMESHLDLSGAYSHGFEGRTKKGDNDWFYENVDFDYKNNIIKAEHRRNSDKVFEAKWQLYRKYNDGLSILYASRRFLHSKTKIKFPIVIYEDTTQVEISFTGRNEAVEISALDYDVDTKYFRGELSGKGIYGLSGSFEGWFSNDDASVPISAKLHVLIGYVNIELIQWNRKGWQPPKK